MRQFRRRDRGFTLLELMLALSLGVMVFGVLLNLIAGDLRLGGAMATRLRESARQRRTLELIRDELALGQGRMLEPPVSDQWPCAMAGRRPVLAIATEAGDPQARRRAIVYSVGRAPSAIWRGPGVDALWTGLQPGGPFPASMLLIRIGWCWMHSLMMEPPVLRCRPIRSFPCSSSSWSNRCLAAMVPPGGFAPPWRLEGWPGC